LNFTLRYKRQNVACVITLILSIGHTTLASILAVKCVSLLWLPQYT